MSNVIVPITFSYGALRTPKAMHAKTGCQQRVGPELRRATRRREATDATRLPGGK